LITNSKVLILQRIDGVFRLRGLHAALGVRLAKMANGNNVIFSGKRKRKEGDEKKVFV